MTNDDTKELTLCRFYVALGGKVEGIWGKWLMD
jgi:hypothetical protein